MTPAFFVAIDPGLAKTGGSGWAYFGSGALLDAGVLRNAKAWASLGARIRGQETLLHEVLSKRCDVNTLVVAEWMVQIYHGKGRSVPPQDLINLNALTGKLGDYYVTPTEWKGKVARDLEQSRTRCTLSPVERNIVDASCGNLPKSVHKEVLSAVGIGLSVARRAHKKCGWPE